MRYQELLDEYMVLLDHDVRLRQKMHQIPKGYLYLQFSYQGSTIYRNGRILRKNEQIGR